MHGFQLTVYRKGLLCVCLEFGVCFYVLLKNLKILNIALDVLQNQASALFLASSPSTLCMGESSTRKQMAHMLKGSTLENSLREVVIGV